MNLPNTITILRILVIPIFAYLILVNETVWALAVFAGAGLSDGLDGYIARVYALKTRLGAFLDPLADKLLLLTAYSLLAVLGRLPPWLGGVVVARDMVLLTGILILFLMNRKIEFSPTLLGKVTTFAQLVTIVFVLFSDIYPRMAGVLFPLYLFNLTVTLISGFHYFYLGLKMTQAGTVSMRSDG